MARETETRLSPEDAALAQAEAARKTDLTQGADTLPPRGDEATPPARLDPSDARKAIFQKFNRKHEAEAEADVAALSEEDRARHAAMQAQAAEGYTPPPAPTPSQVQDERVTLTLDGRQITVARSDIENAGGEAAYLRDRRVEAQEDALALRMAEMDRRQQALQAENDRLARLQVELEQRQAAAHEGSATPPGGTPGQGRQGPGATSAEELDAQAEALAAQFYSGDPGEAKAAVMTLLAAQAVRGPQLTAEQVRELVAQQLKAAQPAPATPPPAAAPAPAPDPVWQRKIGLINQFAATHYQDVTADPALAAKGRDEIYRLAQLPENRDRSILDVTREALEKVRRDNHPRRAVLESKQGLPAIPQASGSAPAPAQDDYPTKTSDVIAMMQARRNFGPRMKP